MICNNRGNNRSKLTAQLQLATYPFDTAAVLASKRAPRRIASHAYERSKHERDICGRQIIFRSSAVATVPSLPLESINKRYWPRPKGEHQKQPSKAIKSSRERERERERAGEQSERLNKPERVEGARLSDIGPAPL